MPQLEAAARRTGRSSAIVAGNPRSRTGTKRHVPCTSPLPVGRSSAGEGSTDELVGGKHEAPESRDGASRTAHRAPRALRYRPRLGPGCRCRRQRRGRGQRIRRGVWQRQRQWQRPLEEQQALFLIPSAPVHGAWWPARFSPAALVILALPVPAQAQPALVVQHVAVIDGTDSRPHPDRTVIVRGNSIVTVASAGSAVLPAGARVIDGRGKFLIPGLWDMHVHTAIAGGRALLGLYVANGVTGVRDMAGDWPTLRGWRDDIAAGRLVGPRIVASGPYLEGGDIPVPHLLARTPEEGRAGVDSLVELGVDFVKVHGQLTRETYFAIARRARERGIPFAGHVPRAVGSADASDSGQRSIEHLLAIPPPGTPAESAALVPRYPVQGALGRCSSADLAPLYARFVRNHTWVTPTFVAQVEVAGWPGHSVPGDSLAHYLPDSLRAFVASIFPMPA